MFYAINQYKTMEWFNNILAVIFYSQRISNLFNSKSYKLNLANKTFKIIWLILNKYLFNKYVLDALTKILNTRVFFNMNDYKIQGKLPQTDLWKHIEIINFFNIFGVNCVGLDIINNETYLNLHKLLDNTPIEKSSKTPEVLVVFHHSYNNTISKLYKPLLNTNIEEFKTMDFILSNSITTYDGNEYVLDSIILNNFNQEKKQHTVILTTQDNYKLLYRGLPNKDTKFIVKNDNDPLTFDSQNNCDIKVLNDGVNIFKIDDKCNFEYKKCTISDNSKYCYNLNSNKGDKTFIYVINDDKLLKNRIRNKENNNIRDIDTVIRDIYDIDNMNKDDLIFELNDRYRVFLLPDMYYTTEELREVLKDTIRSYFNEKNKINISPISLRSSKRHKDRHTSYLPKSFKVI